LSPLLARSAEILTLAAKRREQLDELRGLKGCIQTLRLKCLQLPLDELAQAFVEGARNILRRATTTLTQARGILDRLQEILAGADHDNAEKANSRLAAVECQSKDPSRNTVLPDAEMTGTDGQNDRHIESQKSDTKKQGTDPFPEFWRSLAIVSDFYPEIPGSKNGILRIIFEFGKMLGMGQDTLASAVQTIGPLQTLAAQDMIARRAEKISHTDGYLAKLVERALYPAVGHGQPALFAR
ncbi:MAG: replication protein C, partial [Brevundimonas sp.]